MSLNMETYIIRVNGKTYEVEVSKKNEAETTSGGGDAVFSQNGVEAQSLSQYGSRMQANTSSAESAESVTGTGAGAGTGSGLPVTAGTSGKIWKISAEKGEMLKKGDTILILEAMKMEIPVAAPEDGRIESFSVSEGDAVEAGQTVAVMV